MEEDSSDFKWSTHHQKEEDIPQELQHTLKKEIALEETKPASPVFSTMMKKGFIPMELVPGPPQQEHTSIKESLIIVKSEYEGLRGKVYNRQCYVHGQELSVQEETQVATLDSLITINSDSILDRSSPGINTDVKEKFFIGESIAHPIIAQRCKLENESEYELTDISTIQNNSDSSLSNSFVVIKEELILEDTNEDCLIDKWFILNIHSDTHEDICYKKKARKVNQRELQSIIQPDMLEEGNADKQNNTNSKCNKSDNHFAVVSHLADRKQVHSGIRNYECCVCHKAFIKLSHLSRHKKVHTGVRNYVCDVCGKTFIRSCHLSCHKEIHSGIKKYKCDVCHKTFTQQGHLSRHNQIHNRIKNYQCDVCHKTFNQASYLSRHKELHGGIKKYMCDVCHKTFTQQSHLSCHKQIHSGIKNYKCDVCDKTFNQESYLSRHKEIHSGIRKYKCGVCDKSFTHQSNLSRHKQIHSEIKKYECGVRHKAFTQSSNLSLHKQMDSENRKYECDICYKTFIQLRHLSVHKIIHNEYKLYECDVCHNSFTYSSTLLRHKQIHSGIKSVSHVS